MPYVIAFCGATPISEKSSLAYAESFFHTLKVELTHRHRFKTRAEAQGAIFEYIEVWYNRQRMHSALGYKSPVSYELAASNLDRHGMAKKPSFFLVGKPCGQGSR